MQSIAKITNIYTILSFYTFEPIIKDNISSKSSHLILIKKYSIY